MKRHVAGRRPAAGPNRCGVPTLQMFADGSSEEALVFNCTQRAHQNTLEYFAANICLQVGSMCADAESSRGATCRQPAAAPHPLAPWHPPALFATIPCDAGDAGPAGKLG